MNRRSLLKAVPAAGLLAAAPWTARTQTAADPQGWRTFEVVTRPWKSYQRPDRSSPGYHCRLQPRRPPGSKPCRTRLPAMLRRRISMSTRSRRRHCRPRDRAGDVKQGGHSASKSANASLRLTPGSGEIASAQEQARYLKGTDLMPIDGIVSETAIKVTKGTKTDIDKALAIYEWVVENTVRNPKTRGCGIWDVKDHAGNRHPERQVRDLNAMFVALARASGVPARDMYGIRVSTLTAWLQEHGPASGRHQQGTALPSRVLRPGHRLGAHGAGRVRMAHPR